jgi:hypothetical protein
VKDNGYAEDYHPHNRKNHDLTKKPLNGGSGGICISVFRRTSGVLQQDGFFGQGTDCR